jgi:hypothetical protein
VWGRFQALSTLTWLPFEPAVKEAFRRNKAQSIVLEHTDLTDSPQIGVGWEEWGLTVCARYPASTGGTTVYLFDGETLCDREYFTDLQEARTFGSLLKPGGRLGILEPRNSQVR